MSQSEEGICVVEFRDSDGNVIHFEVRVIAIVELMANLPWKKGLMNKAERFLKYSIPLWKSIQNYFFFLLLLRWVFQGFQNKFGRMKQKLLFITKFCFLTHEMFWSSPNLLRLVWNSFGPIEEWSMNVGFLTRVHKFLGPSQNILDMLWIILDLQTDRKFFLCVL